MLFVNSTDIGKVFGVELISSSEMNNALQRWDNISTGKPPWKNSGDEIDTINMAKHISDYRAKLTVLDIGIAISGSARADFLQTLADDLLKRLPDRIAEADRLGGIIIKWNGATWDFVLPGNFGITAKDDNGEIVGAIFASHTSEGNNHFTRLEYHRFEDAGIKAFEYDNDFYVAHGLPSQSLAQSENMIRLLADTYQRTNGEIHNFTRTTAKASQQRLIKVLDTTHFKVMSGATSYTQAVKEAVNEIVNEQTKVAYPTGHVDTIETAVLRAVRTGVAQASGNMAIEGMIERDWDLVRVSAHLGARYGDGGENPGNHFWWQGKLYSRTGKAPGYPLFEEATGYGTGEGLCGWNCRHSFGPGDPNHNPFKDFDKEENKKAYDLSQRQRAAEARIRKTKLKLLGLRQAIDGCQDDGAKATLQEEYSKAAQLLQKQNAAYNDFCEKNNLKRLSDRVSVAKWTRSEAAKATAAARKLNKQ